MALTSTSWDLVVRNLIAGQTVVDDTASLAAAVTHVATKDDGTTYATGALAWNAYGYVGAWVARLNLPATPCKLTFLVSASVTLPTGNVLGKLQVSLEVL